MCAQDRQTGTDARPEAPFVGRQAEMAALHTALDQAQHGTLQLVFVTGDPGIGKTTLVHQFLSQVATPTPLWIGRGQCVEHVGVGLRRTCRSSTRWGAWSTHPGAYPSCLSSATRPRPLLMWLVHLPLLWC